MRRIVAILLTPLIAAGLVIVAEAAGPSTIVDVTAYSTPAQAALVGSTAITTNNITVYDSTGKAVSSASAIGSSPTTASAGYPRDIAMTANLPCQLSVSISGSRVDWTINSAGDYRTLAATIDVTTNLNSEVTMKVAGAANLVKTDDSKQILDTYYNFRTASGAPATGEYLAAPLFNGDKKITVGNNKGTAYLWNRIDAKGGKPAGTYSNTFTVTFSQTL